MRLVTLSLKVLCRSRFQLRLPTQSRRNGSSVVADEPTVTFGAVSGFAYFPFQTSNSVSRPRSSAPARNNSNVTEYSPGGAPSTGAAVLKMNRPSLPVTPFGVNCHVEFRVECHLHPFGRLALEQHRAGRRHGSRGRDASPAPDHRRAHEGDQARCG